MKLHSPTPRRSGMSILEVLIATAIFLMALAGLSQLMSLSTYLALETNYSNEATRLAQGKMNEFVSGIQSLQGQGETPFEEDPTWSWSAECQADGTVSNLSTVTVKITRKRTDGTTFEAELKQMVMDPASKGAVESSSSSSSSGTTTPAGGN